MSEMQTAGKKQRSTMDNIVIISAIIEQSRIEKIWTTYGPIMYCASTAEVDEIGEKVICKYGNIEIGMPVFMDDIAAIGDADTIRKGIRNCRKMETEKNTVWIEKDKIYYNNNWKRESRTNRRRGKGRKD